MPLSSYAARLSTALRVVAAAGMTGAGLAILALPVTPVRAAEPLAFTIPDEDGYGLADCMRTGNKCGEAIATSWCQAHGHAHVAAYGMADDITGSAGGALATPISSSAVIIRCND